MRTIVITGVPNSGKSFCIFHLAKWLVDEKGFKADTGRLEYEFPYYGQKYVPTETDICCVFCNETTKLLLVAATDDENCIKRVKDSLRTLEMQGDVPDILITTCRRFDSLDFKMMCSIMEWKQGETYPVVNKRITLKFRPFEIRTFKVVNDA